MAWDKLQQWPWTGGFRTVSPPVAGLDLYNNLHVFVGQSEGIAEFERNSIGLWSVQPQIGAPTMGPSSTGFVFGAQRIGVAVGNLDYQGLGWQLNLFVAGQDDNVFHAISDVSVPNRQWSAWETFPPPQPFLNGAPVPAYKPVPVAKDNLLSILIASALPPDQGFNKGPFQIGQTRLGGPFDSGWAPLTSGFNRQPSVALNPQGRIQVVTNDTNVTLARVDLGGPVAAWISLPPVPGSNLSIISNPAVAADGNQAGAKAGCLEVVVVGNDGNVYQVSESTPGTWSSNWNNLGTPGPSLLQAGNIPVNPAMAVNADGRLEAFVCAGDNNIYRIAQSVPGGAWAGWNFLGGPGPAFAPPMPLVVADDRPAAQYLLHLFVIGADGNLWHLAQMQPNVWPTPPHVYWPFPWLPKWLQSLIQKALSLIQRFFRA